MLMRDNIQHDLLPYERLAAAIVKQAIQDYVELRYKQDELRFGSIPWERARCNTYLLEKWFLSDWCGMLTYGHGEILLDKIKRGEITE